MAILSLEYSRHFFVEYIDIISRYSRLTILLILDVSLPVIIGELLQNAINVSSEYGRFCLCLCAWSSPKLLDAQA